MADPWPVIRHYRLKYAPIKFQMDILDILWDSTIANPHKLEFHPLRSSIPEIVQLELVKADKCAYRYIGNPTPQVRRLHEMLWCL